MNAVLCHPYPHTYTDAHTHSSSHGGKPLHKGASLTCQIDSPPLSSYKSQCVCVINGADNVVFLTGKQEVPSVVICILCTRGVCVCVCVRTPPPPPGDVCAMFRSTRGVLFSCLADFDWPTGSVRLFGCLPNTNPQQLTARHFGEVPH